MTIDFKGFKGRADLIDPGLVRYYAEKAGTGYREVMAVVDVEAAGHGFDSRGRPKILFEPHYFYKALKSRNPEALQRAVALDLAHPSAPPVSWYGKRKAYDNLVAAMAIDQYCALISASWGMGQIMGTNFALLYGSPADMAFAMMDDEDNHVAFMIAFLKANKVIISALNRREWATVARGYNGASYAKNRYDTKLAAAFERRARLPVPAIILPGAPKPAEIVINKIDEDKMPPAMAQGEAAPQAAAPVPQAIILPETPPTPPAPAATPAASVSGLVVEAVQRKLLALGYFIVGKTDGKYGPNTKAGIARFMMDNGLEGEPVVSDALVAALDTAPPAKIDPDRAKITVEDLRAGGSTIVKHTDRIKMLAWVQGIPAAILAVVTGASDYLGNAWSVVSEAKTALGDVPAWVWIAGVVIVSVFLWWKAKQTQDERVQQERDGRSTLVPKPVVQQVPVVQEAE